jgi:hypothetical protein
MLIAFLYMFRATMCPSSGENTVPMRHLVFDVPIIRRKYLTYATPGICHSMWMTVWYAGRNSALHTGQSSMSTCSDKYQVSHRYGIFSWWWAHSCPKHVEKSNKHIRKIVHQFGSIYEITLSYCITRRDGSYQKKVHLYDLFTSRLFLTFRS